MWQKPVSPGQFKLLMAETCPAVTMPRRKSRWYN